MGGRESEVLMQGQEKAALRAVDAPCNHDVQGSCCVRCACSRADDAAPSFLRQTTLHQRFLLSLFSAAGSTPAPNPAPGPDMSSYEFAPDAACAKVLFTDHLRPSSLTAALAAPQRLPDSAPPERFLPAVLAIAAVRR